MHMLSERTQVLLTKEQRARLDRIAADRHMSLGAVIREAIDAYAAPRGKSRGEAVDRLASLGAPVADWETMKREIATGAGERQA
jgi:predicted transcriptional regulator